MCQYIYIYIYIYWDLCIPVLVVDTHNTVNAWPGNCVYIYICELVTVVKVQSESSAE